MYKTQLYEHNNKLRGISFSTRISEILPVNFNPLAAKKRKINNPKYKDLIVTLIMEEFEHPIKVRNKIANINSNLFIQTKLTNDRDTHLMILSPWINFDIWDGSKEVVGNISYKVSSKYELKFTGILLYENAFDYPVYLDKEGQPLPW